MRPFFSPDDDSDIEEILDKYAAAKSPEVDPAAAGGGARPKKRAPNKLEMENK